MATRLYLPDWIPSDVTPVANGSWTVTNRCQYRKLATFKTDSKFTHDPNNALVLSANANLAPRYGGNLMRWTPGQTIVDRKYVSAPLDGAQSVSGDISAHLQAREFDEVQKVNTRIEVYVVSGDGSTVRGTCLAIGANGATTELYDSNWRNKKWCGSNQAISTVAAQDGDRIVVAIGFSDATGTSPFAVAKWGAPSGTSDLPVDETQTADGVGWVEFSAGLTFREEARSAHTALLRKSVGGSTHMVQQLGRHSDDGNDPASATATITFPGAATAGNLLVFAVAVDGSVGSWGAAPAGWSTVITPIVGSNCSMAVYYKVAAGGETSVTATWTTNEFWSATFMEWYGVTASPLDKTAFTNANAEPDTTQTTGTTATLTQGRELCLAFFGTFYKITGWAPRGAGWDAYANGMPGAPSPYTFTAGWTEAARSGAVQEITSGAGTLGTGSSAAYLITAATAAQSCTLTAAAGAIARQHVAVIATFKINDQIDAATSAHLATLEAASTTGTELAAHTAALEATGTARAAHATALEATATARSAGTATLEATATPRSAHVALLEATEVARAPHTAALAATSTARAAETATLEATGTTRAAHLAAFDQTAVSRAAHLALLEIAAVVRSAHLATLASTATSRAPHTATLEATTVTPPAAHRGAMASHVGVARGLAARIQVVRGMSATVVETT